MKLDRRTFPIGDSIAITIPAQIAKKMGVKKGDHLEVDFKEPECIMTVEPAHPSCKTDAQAASNPIKEVPA